jgi:hypothetical protein
MNKWRVIYTLAETTNKFLRVRDGLLNTFVRDEPRKKCTAFRLLEFEAPNFFIV